MDELANLLIWAARRAGVSLLEICPYPDDGFEDVRIVRDDSFYGINPAFTAGHLDLMTTFDQALDNQLLSSDFSETYFNRFRRIAIDMRQRSTSEGFEFYNGLLARLKKVTVEQGHSPHQPVLSVTIGGTSYFTAIGTNIHFGGYDYHLTHSQESPLPQRLHWPSTSDWGKALEISSLANALAIHLFLYNEREIIYVRRGKVGQSTGLWNSTVNGVMEFSHDHPDMIAGKPDVRATAQRETSYELDIDIDHRNIKWLGMGATLSKCEPFIIGVCKTPQSKSDIALAALESSEQREIDDKAKRTSREKEIRAIHRKFAVRTTDVSFGVGSLTIPYQITTPARLRQVVQQKVLQRSEKSFLQRDTGWTDAGAASLLLCLAHLSNRSELQNTLEALKREYEGR